MPKRNAIIILILVMVVWIDHYELSWLWLSVPLMALGAWKYKRELKESINTIIILYKAIRKKKKKKLPAEQLHQAQQ